MTHKQPLLSVTAELYLHATNTHRQQAPYSSVSMNTKMPAPKEQQKKAASLHCGLSNKKQIEQVLFLCGEVFHTATMCREIPLEQFATNSLKNTPGKLYQQQRYSFKRCQQQIYAAG